MMAILDLRLYTNNIRKSTICHARARVFLPDYGSWKDRITTSKKIGGHARHILLVRQIVTSMMKERSLDRSDLFFFYQYQMQSAY